MKNNYIIKGKITEIEINKRNNDNIWITIDTDDLLKVNSINSTWYADEKKKTNYFKIIYNPHPNKKCYLDNFICDYYYGVITHKNNNYLDFRKVNLEISKIFDVGVYKYNKSTKESISTTNVYQTWHGFIQRCYDNKFIENNPAYIGCKVCREWLEFDNFQKWFNDNYYNIKNETITLDKDILLKGNKLYSNKTCIFVPKSINSMFSMRKKQTNLPIGVFLYYNKKYISKINCNGKRIQLGTFNNPEEAFNAYAKKKKEVMFDTLLQYKGIIPNTVYDKLYEAFTRYKIEITD